MSRFGNLEFGRGDEKALPAKPLPRDQDYYLLEAQQAFESGHFEQALRTYSKVLEFNPKCAQSWAGQVRMLIELGEFDEARLWADKALALLPDDGDLLAAKAVALGRLGDLDGALSYSDAAVESQGNTSYIWLSRGDVLMARKEKRAEFCFQKALDLENGKWVVLWLISRIQCYYEHFARGLKLVQDALALDAGRAVLWLQFAHCQIGLGLAGPAQQSLLQARQLDPSLETGELMALAAQTSFMDKAAAKWRQWFRQ